MTTRTPGPRQTIDHCVHPTLGEGLAVYDNGPAMFITASGEVVEHRSIGGGGSGGGRSYLSAFTMAGDRIQLDTTKRQRGHRHCRRWSPIFGAGWLVSEAGPVYPGSPATPAQIARYKAAYGWERFEPDDGSAPIRWQWNVMRVGRLEGKEPRGPKSGKPPSAAYVEWDRWTVIGAFEFRDSAPEDPEAVPPTVGQTSMPGVG